jgi:hypothetical protein
MTGFSRRQLVTIVAALALAVVLVPVGASAAGQLFSIVDPQTGSKARVDAGRLRVGDGSGPLTVDGVTALAAPAQPFNSTVTVRATGPEAQLVVQRRGRRALAITSITAFNSQTSQVVRYRSFVVGSSTFVCPPAPDGIASNARELDVPLLAEHTQMSVEYPSPLVFFAKSRAGTTSCLYVSAEKVGVNDFNITTTLNGFWV